MRDSFDGEDAMKKRTLGQNPKACRAGENTKFNQYLRMSQGMKMDTQNGYAKFCDYVYRAMFYPFVSAIHAQSLGMINSREADFELPSQFNYMLEDATASQEPLAKVLSMINSQQILMSRIGIMLEVNEGTTTAQNVYNIVSYFAENIIDWEYRILNGEQVPTFVNLKESKATRAGSSINYEDQYRILQLDESGNYFQWVSETADVDPEVLPPKEMRVYPKVGGKLSQKIPFICINVEKLGFEIENPFLEAVADSGIKVFQADAEYRNTMYFTSNATLVTIGVNDSEMAAMRIGAGGLISISSPDGDAKFISAPADSLDANAQNVNDLKIYCASLGVDVLQTTSPESGVALNTRIETKSSSLKTLSETGANGLQALLQIGAEWQGVTGDVKIVGNTDFKTAVLSPKDLLDLMGVMTVGGLTEQDYFNKLKNNGYTNSDSLEDWKGQKEIEVVI
jgi:hypothetical protein